jgi:hypothetical protein
MITYHLAFKKTGIMPAGKGRIETAHYKKY